MRDRGTPYLGDTLWSLRRVRRDPIRFLETLARTGGVHEFSIAGQRAFLVSDAADAADVLVARAGAFVKPSALKRAGRLLGNGLLTADGPGHVTRRRLAQPAFARGRLDAYASAVIEHARAASGRWQEGSVIDLVAAMGALTLTIAGRTLFDCDLSGDVDAIRAAVTDASDARDALVSLLAPRRRLAPAKLRLRTIVGRLVDERLRNLTDAPPGDAPTDDALTTLCRAHVPGDKASLEQLHDDVLTLLLASHDTIATAMVSTWALLADHPDAAARMHEELDALAGPVSAADATRLPVTSAVFAESLRLQPPAWIIARQARIDCEIGGRSVPEGSLVVISPYVMHRDRRYFDDPLAFRPERWLADPPGRPRTGYLPFGAGPRACIGESFATMEGTLLLATIGGDWRLIPTTPQPIRYDVRITLRPSAAVPVRLERRQPARRLP